MVISVVMPAYNAATFIGEAIDSILNQTYQDFELIIVDDGSSDGTAAIIQEYAARDKRIRLAASNRQGPGGAMNVGIEMAQYPWIAVMHADDVALPERLSHQLEKALSDPEVAIWGTNGYHINTEGQIISRFLVGPMSKKEFLDARSRGEIVQSIHPTVMFHRDLALKVGGYDPTFSVAEDIEFFDRMLEHGPLITIPENLMKYRIHGSSLTMQKYQQMIERVRFIRARQKLRLEHKTELSYEEYQKTLSQRSWLTRALDRREELTGYSYRRAGMAYGEKDYATMVYYLIIAFILNPIVILRRANTQRLRPGIVPNQNAPLSSD